ncbi:MAG: WD40 repeat domain-containing protein, partial [Cyanobacteria bacterium P01_F01_bin.4]
VDAVEAIAYSSDGDWVATGSRDGVVKLWQPSGQLQKTLPRVHKKHVYQVAFSPGSQYLATASEDGDVFLWTQADGFRNPTVLSHGADKPVFRIAFSFDGQYIASADITGQVRVWSLEGELLKTFEHDRPIFTMQFSPQKNLLAFAGVSGVIQLEDLEQETTHRLADHDGRIWQIAFSSDGATLASASDDSTVKLWTLNHLQEPTLAHTLSGHGKRVYRVRFGPQDNMLATGGADGTIRLWLRDKGTLVETLEGHKDDIWSLAFSPRLREAEVSTSLEYASSVATNSLASFSHVLASASIDGDIRLWNIDSPVQPLPHENRVFDVDFRPDGAVVASSGVNTIRLWWRRDGTLRSHIKYEEGTRVLTLDYSNPNGNLLAAGGNNGHIQIWKPDMSTHKPNQKLEQAHPVSNISSLDQGVADVQFSPNGQWLASGGSDSTLKLWQVKEDDKLYRYITLPHPAGVTGLDFSADHQFLVASTRARLQPSTTAPVDSGSIVLWKMPDESQNQAVPKQIFEFSPNHHTGDILTVAINPTQPKLIASGGADGKINLWDMEGTWIRTLEGHTDEVTRVSFSKDGLFLASASRDGSIRLWMVQNGDLISVLDRHTGEVSSAVFDPGGNQTLASASFDNDVLLWQLWNLSDAEAKTLNKRPAILQTLIQMGCSSAKSFLDSYDYEDKNFKQLSPDDQESINEIKEVQKFCSDYLD